MRYRTMTVVGLVAVATLSLGGTAVPATDRPDRTAKEGSEKYVETSPLPAVQQGLDALNEKLVERDDDSLGGTSTDVNTKTLNVWWKGEVPHDVREIGMDASPLTVSFHQARFTRRQLEGAARRLRNYTTEDGHTVRYVMVDSLEFPAAVHGLRVAFDDKPDRMSKEQVAQISAELLTVARLPVAVDRTLDLQPLSRHNDSDPWYGGGALISQGGSLCSTGFAAKTSTGSTRLLTAGHCDESAAKNDTFYDGTAAEVVSDPPNDYRWGLDSLVIDPNSTAVGRVFAGPWNAVQSTPRYTVQVANRVAHSLGVDNLCTSGANSGERCNLDTYYEFTGNCGTAACTMWLANAPAGSVAAASGDSGGPAYSLRSDGRVTAKGIITSGTGSVPCPSIAWAGSVCNNIVAITDISDVLNTWGLTILPSP